MTASIDAAALIPPISRRLIADATQSCVVNLAVVIVTWRDHKYTIGCLRSLLLAPMRPRFVVIVDNGSADETGRYIDAYLSGVSVLNTRNPFTNQERISGIHEHARVFHYLGSNRAGEPAVLSGDGRTTLVSLIVSAHNGGFASGNNIGIHHLQQVGFNGCVWLLNNDAYVAPDCVAALYRRSDVGPLPLLFGTALVEYSDVNVVQALGGVLSSRFLSPKHARVNRAINGIAAEDSVVYADYPVGASLLTWADQLYTRTFPLFEGYFLYFEEADLRSTLKVSECPIFLDAVVAHVGGAATGDNAVKIRAKRSFSRDYYGTRSRVLYARRHAKGSLFFVALFCALLVVKRVLSLDLKAAWIVARGAFSGARAETSDETRT